MITNIMIRIILRGLIIIPEVITEAATAVGIVAEVVGISNNNTKLHQKRAVPGSVSKSQKGTALSFSFPVT
ncbi:hypothetical protein [Paenibacillus amylolyticus]|uniref:hypothetical protein n=1 Tax=Paenibacillus amylolyticus TaxID=1451 RepID=UPI003EBE5903